jgi:hypothetical protein
MLGGRSGDGHQRIKTSIAGTSKQNAPSFLILYQKEERMEFNKDMII